MQNKDLLEEKVKNLTSELEKKTHKTGETISRKKCKETSGNVTAVVNGISAVSDHTEILSHTEIRNTDNPKVDRVPNMTIIN